MPDFPTYAERRACRDARGHHPWRFFSLLSDWTLEWTRDLPAGRLGLTVHDEKRVLLAEGMDQAERRCTIAHETGHILRGPSAAAHHVRDELHINRQVGRLLLPSVRSIGHALAWHQADHEKAAYDLWVDEQIFNTRISTLPPGERAYLDEQLATILI